MDQESAEDRVEKKQIVARVRVPINGRKKLTLAEIDHSADRVLPLDRELEGFVFKLMEVDIIEFV